MARLLKQTAAALVFVGVAMSSRGETAASEFCFERHAIANGDAPITLHLAFTTNGVLRRPVILMLGSLETNRVPAWSTNLVKEGFMLAAFTAAHPPDPDPKRRPVWLYFDERLAHSYALGGARAIADTRRVVEYLATRSDVNPEKIGWLGSSSTAIPGLAVVTQGLRLAAFVGFVCTGAYEQWFETWREHGLWRSGTNWLWPETVELLQRHDPIRHATNAFPTAVLMVSGGADKVVDAKTARAFAEAARSAYTSDPDRLRLLIYDGFGHNLPADVVQEHAEHWFRLYLNPTNAPPASALAATNLAHSVVRSQINTTDHRTVIGADTSVGAELEWIVISKNAREFVGATSQKKFTPWGFNYDRDYMMRLLEEYWDAEWTTVTEDFREMKALGANVVRVHLQFASFMETPDRPNMHALDQFTRLVRLAEQTGLYLDVTGLGCYRKTDVPAWFGALDETRRWAAQAKFWEAVAEHGKTSPAIFCYNLMNEPFVPTAPRVPGDWIAGQLAGFCYVQAITLNSAGRPRYEIARQWISLLATAIRKHDTRHLITVGLLPNSSDEQRGSGFAPSKIADRLDFLAVHVYPKSGRFAEELTSLRGFVTGTPVLVEETFPLNCTVNELRQFMTSSEDPASGWISFYWGQTLDELAGDQKAGSELTHEWLKAFRLMNPNGPGVSR